MEVKIEDQKAQLALAIKHKAVTAQNMHQVINESYAALGKKLAESGQGMAGAPFLCYTNMSENESVFDLEAGFPIAEEITVDGDFYITKTYEGKAVETVHKGSYDTLEKTYGVAMQYIAENKLEPTGIYYDFYLSNPENTPPEELLTKVVIAVK